MIAVGDAQRGSTMTIAKTRVTREDYRRLPEGPPYYELIDGELVEMPRPIRVHYRLAAFLISQLEPHISGLRGELAPEPNLYLPGIEEVYHPDLVYVARANRRICKDDGIRGVPDMICEILSPNTWRTDRYRKFRDYRLTGVPHVWLIQPEGVVAVEEYVLAEDGSCRQTAVLEAPEDWRPAVFPELVISLAEAQQAVTPLEE
jgi:Uma2 family endonuclease